MRLAFQMYSGSQEALRPNRTYTVRLRADGVEPHQFHFTSRYSPLYASAKVVRSDTGTLLVSVPDDVIYFTAWLAGRDAEDLLVRKEIVRQRNTAEEQRDELTQFLTDPRNRQVKFALEQYVRYRTALDLVTGVYLVRASQGGQVQKKLGELMILRESRPPRLQEIIGTFEDELALWESRMTEGRGLVAHAVRGGRSSPYPLSGRRSF